VLALERDDQALDLKRQAVRLPVWPSGSIRQALKSMAPAPRADLVAGLARDIELPAPHRHLVSDNLNFRQNA
jgi:hypothetical protein